MEFTTKELIKDSSGEVPAYTKYGKVNRDLRVGEIVTFLCNGRGRGGHLRVTARVTKVNRKTFRAVEMPGSYRPGTDWSVNIEYAMQPGNGGICIELNSESK